jgi:hypothetical protein
MINAKEPKGKMTVDKVVLRQKGKIAIYFDLYLKDESGKIFIASGSKFLFDLRPVKSKE